MEKKTVPEMIMFYTDLMDRVTKVTSTLLQAAKGPDLDTLIYESENRERLINILGQQQKRIESEINNLDFGELTNQNLLKILTQWNADVFYWTQEVDQIDQEIINTLLDQKEETTREIARLFSVKNQLKGYNLNNVSK